MRVKLLDGTFKTVRIQSQSTAEEVAHVSVTVKCFLLLIPLLSVLVRRVQNVAAKMALNLPKFLEEDCFGIYEALSIGKCNGFRQRQTGSLLADCLTRDVHTYFRARNMAESAAQFVPRHGHGGWLGLL